MPYSTNGKRDYSKEQKYYEQKNPKRKGQRAALNRARRKLMAEGKVKVGDGKDVSHRRATSKGGSMSLSNLFVQNSGKNRSFSRNKDGSLKSETSRKERKKK